MTNQTYTFELTAEQAEDLFDCINVASLHSLWIATPID